MDDVAIDGTASPAFLLQYDALKTVVVNVVISDGVTAVSIIYPDTRSPVAPVVDDRPVGVDVVVLDDAVLEAIAVRSITPDFDPGVGGLRVGHAGVVDFVLLDDLAIREEQPEDSPLPTIADVAVTRDATVGVRPRSRPVMGYPKLTNAPDRHAVDRDVVPTIMRDAVSV